MLEQSTRMPNVEFKRREIKVHGSDQIEMITWKNDIIEGETVIIWFVPNDSTEWKIAKVIWSVRTLRYYNSGECESIEDGEKIIKREIQKVLAEMKVEFDILEKFD